MSFASWISSLKTSHSRRVRTSTRRSTLSNYSPSVERLEDRVVPTVLLAGFTESVYSAGLDDPTELAVDVDSGGLIVFSPDSTAGPFYSLDTDLTVTSLGGIPGDHPFVATDIEFHDGFAYTANFNQQLVRIDPATGADTVLTTFSGASNEQGIAIKDDVLFATSGNSGGTFWSFDLNTSVLTVLATNFPTGARGLEYVANTDQFFMATTGSGIYEVFENGTFQQLNNAPTGQANLAVDADAEFAYVTNDGRVDRIDLGAGQVTQFLANAGAFTSISSLDDLAFGPASTGPGASLFVTNRAGDRIVEISGNFPLLPGNLPATDDSAETDEDLAVTIDVLANDGVPVQGTLAITSVSAPTFGTAVIDDNSTPSVTDDDKIIYTPSLNDNGTVTFEYTIGDGLGNTGRATVTVVVNPVNDAPVVDLNGEDEAGIGYATTFTGTAVALSDTDGILADVDGGVIGTATGGNGDIFVVNIDGRITKIDPSTGVQTQISTGALILNARNLAIDDATGDLFVADAGRGAVVQVDRNTGAESIIATGFGSVWGIAVEADGNVLVSDRSFRSIVRVDPTTGGKSTLATGLVLPFGIALESNGDILVADANRIVRIDPVSGVKTTLSSGFSLVTDVAVDANGDILASDISRRQIIRVDATTGSQTVVSSGGVLSSTAYAIDVDSNGDIVASIIINPLVTVIDGSTGGQAVLSSGGFLSTNIGLDIDGGVGVRFGDNVVSLTVSITNLLDGANEVLAADTTGTAISASYDSGTGVLSLTGDDTAENYQAVLRTVTYNNTAASPFTTARVISFVANDGLNSSQPPAFATVALNRPPTANDDAVGVNEDDGAADVTAALLAGDTDPDASDILGVSAIDSTGTVGSVSLVGGVVSYDPNGQFESLAVGETANDTFGYTVDDGNGGTDTATVTVTVTGQNDAPTADNDAVGANEDDGAADVTATLLGNDTDPDGSDILSVSAIDTTGTVGTVSLVGGVVSYNPNGQFESLAVGETANDTFGYTVSDGNGGADTATVTVTVTGQNDAPTDPVDGNTGATNEVAENALTDTEVGITASSSDVDNGAVIKYSLTDSAGGRFKIHEDTGVVTVADGSLLDYETDTSHSIKVQATDEYDATSAEVEFTISVLNEANVTGFVFADVDNDGVFDVEDAPLANVEITLTEAGVDELFGTLDDETFTTTTDNDGFYGFEDVAAGKMRILESGAPVDLADGVDTPDGVTDLDTVNDQFTIALARTDVNGMNFAEQADVGGLGSGDTATIGYWHNKNGQALIEKLDEDGALTAWLLDNFDNIFDQADFDEYGGSVGAFYRGEFFKKKLKGTPKVDAQFMAVAFATFATSSNLSNGAAVDFGFNVTDSGIATTVVNVETSGAAFGVADYTDMTIMALLLATDSMTGVGADLAYDDGDDVLTDVEKALRVLANDTYTTINEEGDI